MPAYDVRLKQVDSLLVASHRDLVPLELGLDQSFGKILAYLEQQRVQPGSPTLVVLHSRSKQRDDGLYIDIEAAIPIPAILPASAQIAITTLAGGLMASTIHTGPDLFLGQAYVAIYSWMKDNGYRIIAAPRQIFHRRGTALEPAQYVTEVQYAVEEL